MDVDVANKLNDHEMRIAALEDDDKKVHGFIAWIDSTVTNNPKLTLFLSMLVSNAVTAVGVYMSAKQPAAPAPVPIVKPSDDKKAELPNKTKWVELPK